MGDIPPFLLTHTVTVSPYRSGGFGPAAQLACLVDEAKSSGGGPFESERTTPLTIFAQLGADCPAGSLVTLPDGRTAFVHAVTPYYGGGLPTPDHVEIQAVVTTFVPTTTVTVYRGTAVDEYGDLLDADTVVASGVPAAIAVSASTEVSPEAGREYVVSEASGRVASTEDIRVDDRLRDDATGYVYEVRAVLPAPVPALNAPTSLVLKLIRD